MLATLNRQPVLSALLLGLAVAWLFTAQLTKPSIIYFDEVHYVPAARALIDLSTRVNPEHPLLGKLLIATGIVIAGDTPLGWRIMSALAGIGTVMGVYWAIWLMTRRVGLAVLGAVLVAINGMVFVHARIAMLEPFLALFLVLSLVALIRAIQAQDRDRPIRLVETGVLLGLATAVKWLAVPYVALACLVMLVVGLRHDGLGSAIRWPLAIGASAVTVYFLTFLPLTLLQTNPVPVQDLVAFQGEMLALQRRVLPPHPYQSDWWTWPLLIRPIWYFFEPDQGIQRGVLMIGNPAIFWAGLPAVLWCLWTGIRRRDGWRTGSALLWAFSLGIWAIIPKSLGFLYYYQMSSIWLCLCLAYALSDLPRWWRRGFMTLAILLLVYFYPILAADALPDPQLFNIWMWFDSWR